MSETHHIPNRAPRFEVPLDLVLAMPTSSVMRGLIQDRRNRGDFPLPMAEVFAQGKQYFALVGFGPGRNELLIPLDVWVWRSADGDPA